MNGVPYTESELSVPEQVVRSLPRVFAVGAILLALAFYNYAYFHAVLEIFSIVVAASVLIVAWNGRRLLDNDYLLLIGFAYLYYALLGIPHLLSTAQFGLFPAFGPNLPAQVLLIQRFLTAAAFLAAPLFLRRRLPVRTTIAVLTVASVALMYAVLITRTLPVAFAPGTGYTAFSYWTMAIISAMFLGSALQLYRRRSAFDPGVLWMLISVTLAFVASGLLFLVGGDRRGPIDTIASLTQALAFYLTYKAVVETAYVRPYTLMFRQLAERERGVSQARRDAEQQLATTRLLLEAADNLAGWTDLDSLLEALGRIVLRAVGHERAMVLLWDRDAETIAIANSVGAQPTPQGRVITWAELSEPTRTAISDKRTTTADYDSLPPERRGLGTVFHMHLALLVPMIYQDDLVGLIVIDDPDGRHGFMPSEVEVAEGIASEAAVAIHTARLIESLQQTEIRFRATFDSAAAGLVLADLNGAILQSNTAFNEMLGYSSAEARGKPISDFSLIEDAIKDDLLLKELVAGQRESYRIEKRYFRKDGGELWGSLSSSLVRDDTGRPLFIIAVIEDVSERKRAEDVLREKDRAIRQAYTDVIDAVTGGKLILMTAEEITDALGDVVMAPRRLESEAGLAEARFELTKVLESLSPPPRVVSEYVLATAEALVNALKYGHGGEYSVRRTQECLQVVVSDFGPGIDFSNLPRATLVPGFSTQTSLGMGFTIMLEVADRVLLSTQPKLTLVVLEVEFARVPEGAAR